MTKKPSGRPSANKKEALPAMPATMEKMMREFVKIIEGGDETVAKEDLNALMTSLSGPSAYDRLSDKEADAKDEAQQIAFDAMEAENEMQARKLAKRALKLDPNCVDALLVMNDLAARTSREMIEGLQKAVAAGERTLGAEFIKNHKGRFWLLLETRPYMRALECLGRALLNQGIRCDAIGIYEKMLELNPNDNQGVRDPLLGLYLETGDLDGASRLIKKYKSDASANFAWGRVLERFLAGDCSGATKALSKARKANRHVELYLTAQKPLPTEPPEMYSSGSEEEAALCLSYLSGAWVEHKEATHWLFERFAETGVNVVPGKAVIEKPHAVSKRLQ